MTRRRTHLWRAAAVIVLAMSATVGLAVPAAAIPASPSAPTITSVGAGVVSLSWVAPSGATGYDVFTLLAGHVIDTDHVTTTSFTATGLNNGTPYTFKVSACDGSGCSSPSPASVEATPGVTAPAQPLAPTVGLAGDAQVTISWQAPESGGTPITGYTAEARTGGATVASFTGNALTTTFTGLVNDTSYSFRVRATNAAGAGPFSPESAVATPAAGAGGGTNPGDGGGGTGNGGGSGGGSGGGTSPGGTVLPAPDANGTTSIGVQTPTGTVSLTFSGVGAGSSGSVVVTPLSAPPASGSVGLVAIGSTFDITPTVTSFTRATVCLPYQPSDLATAGIDAARLALFHFAAGRADITERVDTVARVVCGTTTSFSPFSLGALRTDRVWGDDRYSTSAAVSAATFAPGVPVAYVATGLDPADALAAGPAAARAGGPILLVQRGSVPSAVDAELARLAPGRIVILGGEGAVASSLVPTLQARTSGTVERLQGASRFATAAAISGASHPDGASTVYVATGRDVADALAAGAAAAVTGAPVLLTERDALPAATEQELRRLAPSRVVVVGGTAAVADRVFTQVRSIVPATTRLMGSDRYATALAVSKDAFPDGAQRAYLAGGNFYDALSAVAAAGFTKAPVLLVPSTNLPSAAGAELDRLHAAKLVVLGGTTAISRQLESEIALHIA